MIRSLPLIYALATAPAGEAPLRASLEVDATALGDAGDALGERLQTRGETVLRDADIEEGQGAGDPVISVVVEPLPQQAGYRCTYELRDGGEPVEGTQAATECRLCTDAELEEQVNGAIGRLVARLHDASATAEPEPGPDPPPPVPVDTAPGPWRIGKMGQAGIGVSVAGGFTLGLGLGLAIAEPILLSKGTTRTGALQVPGITTAAIGGALLITGVVLLAVDQARSRRLAAGASGLTLRF